MKQNNKCKIYVLYDEEEQLVCVGNAKEIADYFGTHVDKMYSRISHALHGGSLRGGYTIHTIEERDEEDDR